jgi:hypothetical protein
VLEADLGETLHLGEAVDIVATARVDGLAEEHGSWGDRHILEDMLAKGWP